MTAKSKAYCITAFELDGSIGQGKTEWPVEFNFILSFWSLLEIGRDWDLEWIDYVRVETQAAVPPIQFWFVPGAQSNPHTEQGRDPVKNSACVMHS